jgi:hypothetical protein
MCMSVGKEWGGEGGGGGFCLWDRASSVGVSAVGVLSVLCTKSEKVVLTL